MSLDWLKPEPCPTCGGELETKYEDTDDPRFCKVLTIRCKTENCSGLVPPNMMLWLGSRGQVSVITNLKDPKEDS